MDRHFHHELEGAPRPAERNGRTRRDRAREVDGSPQDAEREAGRGGPCRDLAIDRIELQIESQSLNFLGLQQPVARDLRFLVAAIRISNDLERIGTTRSTSPRARSD